MISPSFTEPPVPQNDFSFLPTVDSVDDEDVVKEELWSARPPPVEPMLDLLGRERQARGHAVDHDADRRPVALAPGGEAEQLAEGGTGHGSARAHSLLTTEMSGASTDFMPTTW